MTKKQDLINWYLATDPFEEDTPRSEEINNNEENEYEEVSFVRFIFSWLFYWWK